MANGVNKQILIGNIGKIEFVTTSGGTNICNFSVATGMKIKDKSGEYIEETTWHNCVAFGKLADIIKQYCSKGKKVYVEGPTKHQKYEKDGDVRYATKVIVNQLQLLSPKEDGPNAPSQETAKSQYESKEVPFDDSIPF